MAGTDADVIVFGGGPAGATTALHLVAHGRSVILIERSLDSFEKTGEALPPGAKPELVRLGLWEAFLAQGHLQCWSVRSAWNSPELEVQDFSFHPYGCAWHIERGAFERLLIGAARDRGAQVIRGASVIAAHRNGDDSWTVAISTGRNSRKLRGRFLVDATGRSAALGRQLGLRRLKPDRLVGILAKIPIRSPPSEIFTLVEAQANGWWYLARVPEQLMVAVFLTDSDLLPRGLGQLSVRWHDELAKTTHARTLANVLEAPARVFVRPADSAKLETACGDGWIAVGDAALSFDPLSSQGICNALETGRWAATTINGTLGGRRGSLERYEEAISYRAHSVARMKSAYYALEGRWPAGEFWTRRRHM